MKSYVINPSYKYFFFVFIVNLFAYIFFSFNGYFVWENEIYIFTFDSVVFLAFFLSSLVFIFFTFFIDNLAKIYVFKRKYLSGFSQMSTSQWKLFSWILFFIVLISSFVNFKYGINVAGKANPSDISIYIKLLTLILNPDYLCPIFLCLKFYNFRLYCLIAFVCIISFTLRGWMGGWLIVFVSMVFNYSCFERSWPLKTKKILLFFIFFVILLLPFLLYLKYFFRGEAINFIFLFSGFISYIEEHSLFEIYADAFMNVIFRFQSFDMFYLFMKNMDLIQFAYSKDLIIPFFKDNMFFSILFPSFVNGIPAGQYLASLYLTESVTWATHPGFIGWILMAGFPFILVSTILVFFHLIVSNIIGGKSVKFLSLFYIATFLFHGWLSAYINTFIYLFIFMLLVYLVKIIDELSNVFRKS